MLDIPAKAGQIVFAKLPSYVRSGCTCIRKWACYLSQKQRKLYRIEPARTPQMEVRNFLVKPFGIDGIAIISAPKSIVTNEYSTSALALPTHHCSSCRWGACTGKYAGGYSHGTQFRIQRRG